MRWITGLFVAAVLAFAPLPATADDAVGTLTIFEADTTAAGRVMSFVDLTANHTFRDLRPDRLRPEYWAFLLSAVDRYAEADSMPHVRLEMWHLGMPIPIGADSTILEPNTAASTGDTVGYYTRRAIPPQVDSLRVTVNDPTATGGWLGARLWLMGVRVP